MRADAIALIEAAYEVSGSVPAWLRRITAAAQALTVGKRGVASFIWQTSPRGVDLTHVDIKGLAGLDTSNVPSAVDGAAPDRLTAMYVDAPPVSLASQIAEHTFNVPSTDPKMVDAIAKFGLRDLVGVNGHASAERGVLLSFGLTGREVLTRADARMWARLAVHVGTGMRLRSLKRSPPDAVLSAGGRLLHAEPAAQRSEIRDELAAAARGLDRARGKLRRVDPDAAVDLWRALVRGEWSLVDRFDSDGRRFVIAQRNAVAAGTRGGVLTIREARVAALAARGYANKLIAYELGLAPSTVSGLLASACRRLGVGSNIELVRLLRTQPR